MGSRERASPRTMGWHDYYALRMGTIVRDLGYCRYCMRQVIDDETYAKICEGTVILRSFGYDGDLTPTLDHITPIVRGGTNYEENVCLACRACNELKGNLNLREFIEAVAWMNESGIPLQWTKSDHVVSLQDMRRMRRYFAETGIATTSGWNLRGEAMAR